MDTDLDLDTPKIVIDARAEGRDRGAPPLEVRLPPGSTTRDSAPASGDDQVYAAAELVRRGLASRVVLVNAPIDPALPPDWEIRGTPVHLERLGDGRTVLTAGPVPHR